MWSRTCTSILATQNSVYYKRESGIALTVDFQYSDMIEREAVVLRRLESRWPRQLSKLARCTGQCRYARGSAMIHNPSGRASEWYLMFGFSTNLFVDAIVQMIALPISGRVPYRKDSLSQEQMGRPDKALASCIVLFTASPRHELPTDGPAAGKIHDNAIHSIVLYSGCPATRKNVSLSFVLPPHSTHCLDR